MRILKALDLKMDRTVRIALWGGEEGPGLGSKTYIRDHFADIETMTLKPEHAKLSCYFNLDNGAGKIRGIYLENNAKVKPIFEAWLAPLKDLGATTVAIAGEPYGTDNRSFDQAGLPGFQFIQDPLDYDIVYHSNMDVYDRLQAEDLKQAALIMASFVYHAAMRGELLPRKPLPKR
jgi:Zn-dependent M28 family amino/carboxypeptidase